MKFFSSLLLIILFFAYCVNAQMSSIAKKQTDKDLSELIGSVHTVRIEIELTEGWEKGELGDGWLPSVNTYNRDGNLQESIVYDAKGNLDYKSVSSFDSSGNKIQEAHFNANEKLLRKFARTYDSKGNETEFRNYNGDEILQWGRRTVYNSEGKITSWSEFDKEGRVTSTKYYLYNKDGKLEEEINDYGKSVDRALYVYKDKSEELKIINSDGSISSSYVTVTDDKGDVTDSTYNDNGEISERKTYKYERDSKGNWIRETACEWTKENGEWVVKRKKITKRTITYY